MNYCKRIITYIKFLTSKSFGLGCIILLEKIIRLLLYPFKYFNKGKNINFFILGFNYSLPTIGGTFFIRHDTDDEFIVSPLFEYELDNLFHMNGGIFLDIGSHIGKYSIKIAKQSKDNNVIAFEANLETYKSVLINIILNDLDNIKVENTAVGENHGELVFLESKRNTGVSRIVHDGGKELIDMGAVSGEDIILKTVKVIYIDDYLAHNNIEFNDVKLIKIDVEGNEFAVLKGMKTLLSQNKNLKLIVEITDGGEEIISYMNNLSYGYKKISETYFVFHSK